MRVHDGADLELRGMTHLLQAMPVTGQRWIAMIVVKSPTDSALLSPDDARELRDWLTGRIEAYDADFCAACPHGELAHDEEGDCTVAECKCGLEPR